MKRPMPTKARSCVGKQRHLTIDAAIGHRRRLLARGAVRLAAYKCKFCAGFHVGHRTKPRT